MASRWRSIPKIDVHAHVVLHQRENTDLILNRPEQMLQIMGEHNVKQAVVLPINVPQYFSLQPEQQDEWLRANNEIQSHLMAESNGRLIAFADCRIDGGYDEPERVREELGYAVESLGLRGLKIHPYNLKAPATDDRLQPWFEAARDLALPVTVHSNPSGHDPTFYGSAPSTVYRALQGKDQRLTVAHLGGISFLETIVGFGYVDVSCTLLMLADLYGIPFCERLLRRIGIDRILFGTDIPICGYQDYEPIFDAMAFTPEEFEKIASLNAERMLDGLTPLEST
jgi:predicted TIM-barrel fold metal-dependent hydrolase